LQGVYRGFVVDANKHLGTGHIGGGKEGVDSFLYGV
jgi:hypothetical protein